MESEQVDILYRQSFNGSNRETVRARVSMFDADYPTPAECRQILACSDERTQAMSKKLKLLTKKRPAKTAKPNSFVAPEKCLNPQSLLIQQHYEQSQNQLSTLGETPLEPFDNEAAANRFLDFLPTCEEIDPDVVAKVSEAAENHLRQLLFELSNVAGHRQEPLRMNPNYQQINDPRKQLRFVKEYEKQMLIQEADEDEEPIKSGKALVNELKHANQEEKMKRDANEMAIAALCGNTGIDSRDKINSVVAPIGQGTQRRPRVRRIKLNDFLCLLECKNSSEIAIIKNHSMYGFVYMSERGHFSAI